MGELAGLLQKFVGRHEEIISITGHERRLLEKWLAADEQNQAEFERIKSDPAFDPMELYEIDAQYRVWKNLQHKITPVRNTLPVIKWVAAAAVIFGLLAVGYWMISPVDSTKDMVQHGPKLPSLPGLPSKDQVVLTLANGEQVIMSGNATIPAQRGVSLDRPDSSQLIYTADGRARDELAYNTIHTPNGRQFTVKLGDGTKIWLNAASVIRFPVSFNAAVRTVELTGEAYFEVAPDKEKPFIVQVRSGQKEDMQVKVLGTHFNISAYNEDDTIRTTLLEGSVQVEKSGAQMRLVPGQQARLAEGNTQFSLLRNVNMNEVIGWKEGMFYFRNADPKTVLHTISRWYNLTPVIKMDPSRVGVFNAEVKHTTPLPVILHLLKESGFKIRLEGGTLIAE
ncbi:hypothetical protein HB364_13585 [Pseudoflavitalea sp. X16]|uniref:FecR domain-containing protein n=1 Tax=Paraflavitalea devenefica TaxID=2716334 RepID=UPI001422D5F2|nr:FecR domain-containing protein [Paraflavitalea devenefica]NII26120.1 hypothetical protein [Paraflavitalea devenefica]